ncbi:helix-turn-helix domain-containing protein [Deferrisoma camini]|uniref:helix-turn-helix domain-containing protein n=1 Tax=Deferrisoma camini TaxID=1035120 RepID=UPI00046CCD16|nr:XRE family transcriptional regulator [Deferrisoma camini]
MAKRIDPELEDLGIGQKIRELRQRRRYTLQDLSAKTGLSKPLLSQVENGHVMPPVATLLKIARALDVNISYFFQEEEKEEKIAVTRAPERRRFTRRSHQDASEVGYLYESLELHKSRKHMEPLLVTFPPLEKKDMVFYSHEGEEFVHVIEGEIEFRTPDEVRTLKPGDSLYFESDVSHAFRALGNKEARALVVVYTGERG